MKTTITVKGRGPLLDGRWRAIIPAAIQRAVNDIAQEGVNRVHQRLHGALKHPTGHFESQVQTDRQFNSVVIEDPVIYGPWLEGVGSRNATTRFKGYAVFRKTTQSLDHDAERIAGPEIRSAVRRIG